MINIDDLEIRIRSLENNAARLEQQNQELTRALKILLPSLITIALTSPDIRHGLQQLTLLAKGAHDKDFSEQFWELMSAALLQVSRRASIMFPDDPDITQIADGLRQR